MPNRTALQTFGRSGNPMFRRNAFQPDATFDETDSTQRMTLAGAVNKTGILLVLCLVSAGYVWNRIFQSSEPAAVNGLMMLGLLGGFIMAMVTVFKRQWAGLTAPAYALLQGLALGGISAMFEMQYPGIVIQAVGLTFGTLAVLLLAYKTGLIKPTEHFLADDYCSNRRYRSALSGEFCDGIFWSRYRIHPQQWFVRNWIQPFCRGDCSP